MIPRLINAFAFFRGIVSSGCGFGRRFTARGSYRSGRSPTRFLHDQLQQPRQIRSDPHRIVKMGLLERSGSYATPL